MKLIDSNIEKSTFFQFFTLVTRFDEYQEMVKSAKNAGFQDSAFYYFDNKNINDFDAFSGINHAIKLCTSKYLIFCHQDILFNFDTKDHLLQKIEELETIDPSWAVIGNAGRTRKGQPIIKITDPHGEEQTQGPLPSEVMSVDENFMIINMKNNLSATTTLKGFHLYGLDLCQNAEYLGLKSYVIDFHLLHKSKGNIDQSFFNSRKEYIQLQQRRKKLKWFFTTCTRFCVTSSVLWNAILNNKVILKLLTSLLRRQK
ncbi:acyl esterase [Acinetobacter boissieri]|uniref:Glycosyltransferase like family protein n=1 Tax=Acinetobacter boissieri TaxID=1219383 RepID=A0A1G6HIJ8_9GAMM|nr:acyl esterase [Acinetobacter boissieri]SDB94089.1 hypothetical protein SAMN05421733_10640 [Acinetobacter boissieri]